MKETLNLWLSRNACLPGVAGACLFYPDRSRFTQGWAPQVPADSLDNAWRCVADTFHVLQLNKFPTESVRWVFAGAFIYCARRGDGLALGLLVLKESAPLDLAAVESLLEAFRDFPVDIPSAT